MLLLLLKRVALEVWDNGFIVFGANLGLVGLMLAAVLIAEGSALDPQGTSFLLAAIVAVVVTVFTLTHGVLNRLLQQRTFAPRFVKSLLLRCASVGAVLVPVSLWLVLLWPVVAASTAAVGLAGSIVLVWFVLTAAQIGLAILASVSDVEIDVWHAVRSAAFFAFSRPFTAAVVTLLGLAVAIISLGLIPGVMGLYRLFFHAGRIVRAAESIGWSAAMEDERIAIARRNPGNVVFPWRQT